MNNSEVFSDRGFEKEEALQQTIINYYEIIEKKIMRNMELKKNNDTL